MPSVYVGWTSFIVEFARNSGVDADPAITASGLDPAALAVPNARIDLAVNDAIWRRLGDELADPELPFDLSSSITTSNLGIAGFLARAAENVAEGLEVIHRFQRLIKDDVLLMLTPSERGLRVTERPVPGRDMLMPLVAETVMSLHVNVARAWTGEALVPLEIGLQHGKHQGSPTLASRIGCKILYDQPENSVEWSHDGLEVPLAMYEPGLAEALEPVARARLDALGERRFIDDVSEAVAHVLTTDPAPELSITKVARRIGVSSRTLQRRLNESGHSFREVVDRVRYDRAINMLRSGVRIDTISEQLGFSEPRALRRAFQRWTGLSPSRARRLA